MAQDRKAPPTPAAAKPAARSTIPVAEQAAMTATAIAQAIVERRLRPGADSLRRLAEAVLESGSVPAKTKKDKAGKKARKALDGGKKKDKRKLAKMRKAKTPG